MKKLLLLATLISANAFGQIDYTVTVLRLKAKADNCDGGSITFCSAAPQDPVFHVWTHDGGGNENTYCWIFDNDPLAEYNLWVDIQNLEIANETNVLTSFISVDMGGFESDELIGSMQCDDWNGDAVVQRTLAQQFDIALIPEGVPYVAQVSVSDTYYAEVEVLWTDPFAGLTANDPSLAFSIAPNPTNGVFHVYSTEDTDQKFNVTVTDMAGRIVQSFNGVTANEPLDISGNLPGSYFVQIQSEGHTKVKNIQLN